MAVGLNDISLLISSGFRVILTGFHGDPLVQRNVLGNRHKREVFMPSHIGKYVGDDSSETKHSQDTLSVVMDVRVSTC